MNLFEKIDLLRKQAGMGDKLKDTMSHVWKSIEMLAQQAKDDPKAAVAKVKDYIVMLESILEKLEPAATEVAEVMTVAHKIDSLHKQATE